MRSPMNMRDRVWSKIKTTSSWHEVRLYFSNVNKWLLITSGYITQNDHHQFKAIVHCWYLTVPSFNKFLFKTRPPKTQWIINLFRRHFVKSTINWILIVGSWSTCNRFCSKWNNGFIIPCLSREWENCLTWRLWMMGNEMFSGVPTWGHFNPPQGIWHCLETFFIVTTRMRVVSTGV